jgi:hypothetical protein
MNNILPPKEKAEELFNQMKGFRVKYSHSKKCGLVALRMLIQSSPSLPILSNSGNYFDNITESTEYWKQVEVEFMKIKV